MNGQILTKLQNVEKELKEIKTLLKKDKKPFVKKSTLAGLWRKLEITDKELEEAKRGLTLTEIAKRLKVAGKEISQKDISNAITAYRNQK